MTAQVSGPGATAPTVAVAQHPRTPAVPPAHLDAVGQALTEHDDLGFVAATTGRTNLVTQALCATPDALHTYLTKRLGAIEHITALETVPILRTVKAAAPFA